MLYNLTPKTQSIKEDIDKVDLFKINNLHSVKDASKRLKGQNTDQEKI